jgi:hypothetical protein
MQKYVIFIADKNLYVASDSSFTSSRASALRMPTESIAEQWCDWMAEEFFPGATWRVVPLSD